MSYYESVFIARQDISSTQVEQLIEQFAEIVATGGGEVKKREYWGLRSLAYRIKKNRKGHYVLFNLDAPAAAVSEMERLMRLNEDILRYLTVKVDALEEGPSVMMQAKSDRDRGRRGDRDRGDRERGDRDRDRGDRGDRDRGDRGDRRPRDGDRAEQGE
ncbi:30S ribosomal protein S6 [Thalassobaculum sp.]|jgi:small subunit ribosomal protein S6|uniref:30S ribosomal protein S6 n=1 Tax=Thalassobaculum sp. TaxID=2022740 RepID=UPI00015F082B|nr:Ribosomal protein S6 [alpha proteobacterium BAL199]